MKYVDAGYAIGLGSLALYAVSLVLRRRHAERAAARAGEAIGDTAGSGEGTP